MLLRQCGEKSFISWIYDIKYGKKISKAVKPSLTKDHRLIDNYFIRKSTEMSDRYGNKAGWGCIKSISLQLLLTILSSLEVFLTLHTYNAVVDYYKHTNTRLELNKNLFYPAVFVL